jgi:uncharacterized membrane protein
METKNGIRLMEETMKKNHKKFIPLFILLGIGVAFLIGYAVQLLWNATITPIFGSNSITYWQAVMLLVLFKILFSSHYNVHKEQRKKLCNPKPEFIHNQYEDVEEEV